MKLVGSPYSKKSKTKFYEWRWRLETKYIAIDTLYWAIATIYVFYHYEISWPSEVGCESILECRWKYFAVGKDGNYLLWIDLAFYFQYLI